MVGFRNIVSVSTLLGDDDPIWASILFFGWVAQPPATRSNLFRDFVVGPDDCNGLLRIYTSFGDMIRIPI